MNGIRIVEILPIFSQFCRDMFLFDTHVECIVLMSRVKE